MEMKRKPFTRNMKLSEYVPSVVTDILDFKYLYDAEDIELDISAERAKWVAYSFFVELCDAESIRLWENIFLVNNSDLDLDTRKREIIKLLAGFKKLSTESIEKIVLDYTSYMAQCIFDPLVSEIQVSFLDVGKPPGIEPLIRYLDMLAPAHLHVVLVELYRTHESLKAFTHEYLSQYTHEELYAKRNI